METEECAKKWDGVAEQFNELRIPSWDEDLFLKTIKDLPVWTGDSRIMDLGCGAGRFSIAVADRCGHVTGSDVSPKMIGFANLKKAEYGKANVTFVNESWHDIDVAERGYEKKFDLVFGHMTPALDSIEDIEKANRASKGYCALATFAKREAPVADRFLKFMETESRWHGDGKVPEFFDHLYKQKMFPAVNYYRRDDTQKFDEDGAVAFLRDRFVLDTAETADEKTTEKIRKFVRSEMQDGVFVNEVNAVIATMVWRAGDTDMTGWLDGYRR